MKPMAALSGSMALLGECFFPETRPGSWLSEQEIDDQVPVASSLRAPVAAEEGHGA